MPPSARSVIQRTAQQKGGKGRPGPGTDLARPATAHVKTTTTFLDLPGEIRNTVYELALVQHDPINPVTWFHGARFVLGLLHANRAVHREAASVVYGRNRFVCPWTTVGQAAASFGRIGPVNAGHVRHVEVNFPSFDFDRFDVGDVAFGQNSTAVWECILGWCPNLHTIETLTESTTQVLARLHRLDDQTMALKALEAVDTGFRAVPSVREIIVNLHHDTPGTDYFTRKMHALRWMVRSVEDKESSASASDDEWDQRLDRFGEDGYSDDEVDYTGHDDRDVDEHDIDSDCNFWRRAAD